MKFYRLLSTLMLSCAILAVALLLLGSSSRRVAAAPQGVTRYVWQEEGSDSGDCTNRQAPCATIGYALQQAGDGDTIDIGGGSYTETLSIPRSVTLSGGWIVDDFFGYLIWWQIQPCTPWATVINADRSGRAVTLLSGTATTLDCLVVTGGRANNLGGAGTLDGGGGIYGSHVALTLTNDLITDNIACDQCLGGYGFGGGLFIEAGQVLISRTTFASNTAGTTEGRGGGAYFAYSTVNITDSTFQRNKAGLETSGEGGGLAVGSGSEITVLSSTFSANVALDGSGEGHGGAIYAGGLSASTLHLSGNTFDENLATTLGDLGRGGALYLEGSQAEIEDNDFTDNIAAFNQNGEGGAICLHDGTSSLVGNRFTGNKASWAGGEHSLGGAFLLEGGEHLATGNLIRDNYGTYFNGAPSQALGYGGGGVLSQTTALLRNNRFIANHASRAASPGGGAGGGLYIYGSRATLERNRFVENVAADNGTFGGGGGVYADEAHPTLDGNLFLRNRAGGSTYSRGGGIRTSYCERITLTNNVLAGNEADEKGSGIAILGGEGQLIHNTLAANHQGDGVGIFLEQTTAAISNTILVSHTVGLHVESNATATVEGTLWGSGAWANLTDYDGSGSLTLGTINLHAEPDFIDAAGDDFHLRSTSAAIDAGITTPVTDDFEGDARSYGQAPDLGADEMSCRAQVVGGSTYTNLQEAIDAAPEGETVRVAAGTCYERLSITRNVALEGGWSPDFGSRYADPATRTTIDALRGGRVISIAHASDVRIDGLTLTGGEATGLGNDGLPSYDCGGGLYLYHSGLRLDESIITDNIASSNSVAWGGGLCAIGGEVNISGSTFISNEAASGTGNGYGGGLYIRYGNLTMSNSRVADNIGSRLGGGYGGGVGLAFAGNVSMRDNAIEENFSSTRYRGLGGGVYAYHVTTLVIDGDRLAENVISATTDILPSCGAALYGTSIGTFRMEHATVAENRVLADDDESGGAVYLTDSSIVISDTHFEANEATFGAALILQQNVSPHVIAGTFENHDVLAGTVILRGNRDARIERCTFRGNTGEDGYDLEIGEEGFALIADSLFTATEHSIMASVRIRESAGIDFEGNQFYGSGFYIRDSDTITMEHNLFAAQGDKRAIHADNIQGMLLRRNRFTGQSDNDDGVIYLAASAPVTLENNFFTDNRGSALIVRDNSLVHAIHTTFAHNGSTPPVAAVSVSSGTVYLTNTILAGNRCALYAETGATVTLEATLWGSGSWSNGTDVAGSGTVNLGSINLHAVPGFVDAANGDYHLRDLSPAIDAGITTDVLVDFDGDPRSIGLAPDLGADENRRPFAVLLPLVMRGH